MNTEQIKEKMKIITDILDVTYCISMKQVEKICDNNPVHTAIARSLVKQGRASYVNDYKFLVRYPWQKKIDYSMISAIDILLRYQKAIDTSNLYSQQPCEIKVHENGYKERIYDDSIGRMYIGFTRRNRIYEIFCPSSFDEFRALKEKLKKRYETVPMNVREQKELRYLIFVHSQEFIDFAYSNVEYPYAIAWLQKEEDGTRKVFFYTSEDEESIDEEDFKEEE